MAIVCPQTARTCPSTISTRPLDASAAAKTSASSSPTWCASHLIGIQPPQSQSQFFSWLDRRWPCRSTPSSRRECDSSRLILDYSCAHKRPCHQRTNSSAEGVWHYACVRQLGRRLLFAGLLCGFAPALLLQLLAVCRRGLRRGLCIGLRIGRRRRQHSGRRRPFHRRL